MKTVPHLELPVDNAQFERSNSQDSLASFMSDVSQSAFSVMSSEADESPLPEPTHIWSMRDSKKGTKDLTHCGVPFPRAKNGSMFLVIPGKVILNQRKNHFVLIKNLL
eukprot:UN26255